jgi:tetratricopeptide (TPR) repeat protein/serine/threonine protein kinase
MEPKSIDRIYWDAAQIASPAEQNAYLDSACANDVELRRRVEHLLQARSKAEDFLESPPHNLVATVVERPVNEGPGTVIGHYKLLEQVGEGGFGVVFMAEQQQPVRRKVALKVLKPGMDTRQVVARFEAERQALALMDHPNIARVFDGGETTLGRPYFVMELVKGIPITDFCDQSQLATRGRLELFMHVCQAVQHAHQKGIIHRDLKPSNVLVTMHDGTPVVKVIDFGIAKATAQQLTEKTLFTNFAQLVGTPLYMSPEQAALSNVDVDTRSDIYSLGVLLYELLTGTTPFDAERFMEAGYDEMRRIIREEEPPRPSTRIATLGQTATTVSTQRQSGPRRLSQLLRGELDWIVMKGMEKDRNRRYETASAFAADVQRYLADEPVLACPPSAGYRLRKFVGRNRTALVVAGLVLSFIVSLGGTAGWFLRDRAARQGEVAQRTRASLDRARVFIAERRLSPARQELAEAKGRLGKDCTRLPELARELEAVEEELQAVDADLTRFQTFLNLVDRAHEAEFPRAVAPVMQVDAGSRTPPIRRQAQVGREPAQAIPYLLRALSCYGALEYEDWSARLERGLLEPEQVLQVRRTAYEELLWLARDVVDRKVDHRSGKPLSPLGAAREGLAYLRQAEGAAPRTSAFLGIRGLCHKAHGEEALAHQDEMLAQRTPRTGALDHYLAAVAAYNARNKTEAVRHFEAALRLEPTHYWSLLNLGTVLCNLGDEQQDFVTAVAVYTGCILKRPDHAYAYFSRAIAYDKLGRTNEAEAEYRQALQLRPDFVEARINLGNALREQQKFADALAEYREALRLDPVGPEAHIAHNNLGIVLLKQRKLAEAEAECREALRLRPDYALAHDNLGGTLDEQGKPAEGEVEHRKALRLQPDSPVFHFNLGVALARQEKWADAEAEYRQALRLRPDYWEAHCNLGNMLREQGRLTEAMAEGREALRLWPDDPVCHLQLGRVLSKMGKLSEAMAEFREALRLRPDYAEGHNNLGTVLTWQGKHAEAEAEYREALRLEPGDHVARSNLGGALTGQGKYADAEAELRQALRRRPDDHVAHGNLGFTLYKQRKYAEAEAEFREALRLRPDSADPRFKLGNALAAQGKLAQAEAEYREALRLRPDYAEAHANLGAAFILRGKHADAEAVLREALRLRPGNPEAHNNLGTALRRQGKCAEAVAEYREALRLRPDYAEAHAELGAILTWQGKHADAEAELREALRLRHDDPEAHYSLGHALAAQGKLAQGEAQYREALRLRPDYAELHCDLGQLLLRQGRFAEALAARRRGHELGSKRPNWHHPSAQWVREAEHLVALDAKLPGVLKGEAQLADAGERLGVAKFCQEHKKLYATAARFYAGAFTAEPKRADDLRTQDRYNAACAAALAGCSQGADASKLDANERARLRRQALDWLRADLAAWGRLLEKGPHPTRPAVQQTLRRWQQDPDFAGVRDDALARLPEAERQVWQQLWADVEQTLRKAKETSSTGLKASN